ncbi:hypothetical protein GCK72_012101 [Caenorhabditis remanei]|uniref:Major facilitator superfamily (MFS) profile domain-containing protein n=1 Tax=Caenorhabditis remanei TaxID=31234 RepID=A0A6A5GLY8_CAERE|nr:hypothetical protein GCK72_012101 [Caenorhabditis remanei]KAF1755651.1 hypothetical protein GCK72_012101 [Caenorhabditis remanei]
MFKVFRRDKAVSISTVPTRPSSEAVSTPTPGAVQRLVSQWLYIFAFVFFFGIAFPFVESPAAALYSEVLGPRKQGMMQGLFSFGGSVTPFVASIIITFLFQHTGYKYVIILQSSTIFIAFVLMLVFYKRMVPLKLKPKNGESAAYKNGVFYSM